MRVLFPGLLLASLPIGAAADEGSCTLYLAESSTSSNDEFKWGIYAGADIEPDAAVGYPDVAIQTFNMVGNARTKDSGSEDTETSLRETVVEFFEQFIWVPDSSGGKFELEEGRTVTAIQGAGVLGGYNEELTNSDWNHSNAYFRLPVGEEPGVTHPGRGAYSTFYDVTLRARHRIPTGMEVFMDYGDNYEKEKDDPNEITRKDYDRIDQVVDRIVDFYDEFEAEMTAESKQDIFDFLVKDVMGAAAGAVKSRKITKLLPDTPDGLREVKEKGGSFLFDKPGVLKSPEWLQENGLCMDKIKMGASTVPHAGRGAFAVRPIKKGELVSPVPVVHLPDHKIVDMHEIDEYEEEEETIYYRASEEVTGKQLLLNYCFGHPESSMLFYPAGSISSFINHNSKKPNAKVVWSSNKNHRSDWFDLELKDLLKEENQRVGLMLEIVATRDIKEGEEVFIDYGKEWESAWKEHLKSWNNQVKKGEISSTWPLRAVDLNSEYKTKVYKTPEELEKEPYPENVQLRCFLVVEEGETEDKDGVKRRAWTQPSVGSTFDTEHLFQCRVVERKDVEDGGDMPYEYSVMWGEGTEEETLVEDVPHQAIVFVDKAETSDQFVQGAFRHYIGIPDGMFPKGPWRDLA